MIFLGQVKLLKDSLRDGEKKRFEMTDEDLTVAHWEGKYFAYESKCPHRKGPIFMGRLKPGSCITCPSHKITFSLETGEIIHNPIPDSMKDYHDSDNLRIFTVLENKDEITVNY